MNYKKFLGTMVSTIAFFSVLNPASAAVISLTIENPVLAAYQQTDNRPCVIGDNSCKGQSMLDFRLIPNGPGNHYLLSSPVYEAIDIRRIVGDVFFIGIDVNAAGSAKTVTETLLEFSMSVNGATAFSFSTPTLLSKDNPGNGFADALLKGFTLAGLADTADIQFTANLSNLTAGDEQFFLIAGDARLPPASIPEPGTTAILGLGLLGMGFLALRGRKKQS